MNASHPDIRQWVLDQLQTVQRQSYILVSDPLHLLPEADGGLHAFAKEHDYTVIVAATNLVFRELYEQATQDADVKKLLVVDRTPASRRGTRTVSKAPPPFYPDFLAQVSDEARIKLDLHEFLKTLTGDPNWPKMANDARYARLIAHHLEAVLRAHQNLRAINASRFTDEDFQTIVAFAALGIPESAFKLLRAEDYWKIGLVGHTALEELEQLAENITHPIKRELAKAPAPFAWLAEHDAERVIRAFYWGVILSQHAPNWHFLLSRLEPGLKGLEALTPDQLSEYARKLIALNPRQAERDLELIETNLDKDDAQFILFEQLKWPEAGRLATAVENENFSTWMRGLAVFLALENLLGTSPSRELERRLATVLFAERDGTLPAADNPVRWVEQRASGTWSNLKQAYQLARECLQLKKVLSEAVRLVKVKPLDQLTFKAFREIWNDQRVNRLEYYLSALERLVDITELLPRAENDLPARFSNAKANIQKQVRALVRETHGLLDDLNRRFQAMTAAQYPAWAQNNAGALAGAPILTAQFLRLALKPHWDPEKEKAVVLIFDGMRYDIWDELLRPLIVDRMEILADLPGASLLPSETHVTRKAISAGTFPYQFDMEVGEDKLLAQGLLHVFGRKDKVETLVPDGAGTGETVRYRAGNLDVYIFELCDKALHHINVKTLPDGRQVPARPLAFLYQQEIKNLIDTEVLGVLRKLPVGAKVFITADHGFGRVARDRLNVEAAQLNAPDDCLYLNAWLKRSLTDTHAPAKLRENVYEFTVSDLRMPAKLSNFDRQSKTTTDRVYASLIFPKVGYALARPFPSAHFSPDAFTHGGLSLQELMIPMVVLRVKPHDDGLLRLGEILGPTEVVESETAEFRFPLARTARVVDDVRVELEVDYGDGEIAERQVHYLSSATLELTFRFKFTPDPEQAKDEERRTGVAKRLLTITVLYSDGHRRVRAVKTHPFTITLNTERIVRRVGNLGNILGLTPKNLRNNG